MFNLDNGVSGKTATNKVLAPNKIHLVKFKGAEQVVVEAKDGRTFNSLQLKWENDEGTYTDTIFEPTAEDMIEKDNGFQGKNPSNADQIIARIKHNMATLNPELHEDIEAKRAPFVAKSWKELCKLTIDALNVGIDKETNIKLLINKNGMATMPAYPLTYNKKGEKYMSTSFIGDQIRFTTKELNKIEAAANATPTTMVGASTPSLNTGAASAAGADLDFDPDTL